MSLATTCPQCKTSFKVVPDQLKLRRGLVRCGICRHVFSGIDFLRYLEDPVRGATIPPSPSILSPTAPQALFERESSADHEAAPADAQPAPDPAESAPATDEAPAHDRDWTSIEAAEAVADGGAADRVAAGHAGDESAGIDDELVDEVRGDETVGGPVAADEVATDEVATDEVATDEVAADEVAASAERPVTPGSGGTRDETGVADEAARQQASDGQPGEVDAPRVEPAIESDAADPSARAFDTVAPADEPIDEPERRNASLETGDQRSTTSDSATPIGGATDDRTPDDSDLASIATDTLETSAPEGSEPPDTADRAPDGTADAREILDAAAHASDDDGADDDGRVDHVGRSRELDEPIHENGAAADVAAPDAVTRNATGLDSDAVEDDHRPRTETFEQSRSRLGRLDEEFAETDIRFSGLGERAPRDVDEEARPEPYLQPTDDSDGRPAADAAATTEDETDAVDYFATETRTRGFSTRSAMFGALAAIALGVVFVLQLAIGARDWLASQMPPLRPALEFAGAPFGLRIHPPRALGALTIESFELQSTGADKLLQLSALLRNGSSREVRWPAMELSLTDGSNAIVVRKVLLPQDYLGAAVARERSGLSANAEFPIRVALEASGVEPTGYSVKLFYP